MFRRKILAVSVTMIALFVIAFSITMLYHHQPAKPGDALSISELLEGHPYDTEIRAYGKVSLLGELFCPCFELESEGEKVSVWYGLMVEDDGSERPPVSVEGINNGDWVIVSGELKSKGSHRSLNDFWASHIEKIDS